MPSLLKLHSHIGFVTTVSNIIFSIPTTTTTNTCHSNLSHKKLSLSSSFLNPKVSKRQLHCRTKIIKTYPLCMVANNETEDETIQTKTDTRISYGSADIESVPAASNGVASNDNLEANSDEESSDTTDYRLVIAGAIFATLFIGTGIAAGTGVIGPDTLVSLAEYFEQLGPWAVFLYAAVYFVLELLAVPAFPLTLGSGYLFGLVKGSIVVSISSTLAAGAGFLIARYWLRESVTNLASRYPKFRAMDRAIAKEGFKFVFLLRLSPLLPFSISNYLYGLTSVTFTKYMVGSWLGMLPGSLAYVSAGAAVNALTDIETNTRSVNPILVGVGIIATIGVIGLIGKIGGAVVEAEAEAIDVDQMT